MRKRTKQYLLSLRTTNPIRKMEEVYYNPDPSIDLDFPGFPHGLSRPCFISPKSEEQKKTAALDVKDGEKIQYVHHH